MFGRNAILFLLFLWFEGANHPHIFTSDRESLEVSLMDLSTQNRHLGLAIVVILRWKHVLPRFGREPLMGAVFTSFVGNLLVMEKR